MVQVTEIVRSETADRKSIYRLFFIMKWNKILIHFFGYAMLILFFKMKQNLIRWHFELKIMLLNEYHKQLSYFMERSLY